MFVFYISGHGFGHASRDVEVINALLAAEPSLEIAIRTLVSPWLLQRTIRGRVDLHSVPVDSGIAQHDSLHMDRAGTGQALDAFMARFDERVADEAEWLREHHVKLVYADIPPLGIAAGAAAGVPTVALGNFTWDWIYEEYEETARWVSRLRAIDERADLALRLPMCGGFAGLQQIEDVPFIARHAQRTRTETRHALGLPLDARVVLVSFGGYGVDGLDLEALSHVPGYLILVSDSTPLGSSRQPLKALARGSLHPLDEAGLYAAGFRYEDLVHAVDVVVTKPGYGIVSECLANGTALLYTSRGPFREYDVLVEQMPRYLRTAFIDHEDLFAGRWTGHLDALLAQPAPPERSATNGAEIVAARLLNFLS